MRDDIFKITVDDHGFVDRIIFGKLTHPVIDFLHSYGFIPNHLTTLSFIFQLWSLHYLNCGYIHLFSINYFIGYYFDCIDGPMARKYHMVTNFGDWYDHITDIFCYLLANYLFIKKYNFLDYPFLITIDVCMIIGLVGYAGCQERIYNKGLSDNKKSKSLYLTTIFIKNEENTIKNEENIIKSLVPFCYTNYVLYICSLPFLLSYF